MTRILKATELKRFQSYLIKLEVKSGCFNLYTTCKKFLVSDFGYSKLNADNSVLNNKVRIEKSFEDAVSFFEKSGLPSPYYVDDYETIKNYNHPSNKSEINWSEYKKILPLFDNPEPIEFLLLCSAAVFSDGASKVISVDGSNDGGIDIITIFNQGRLDQRVVFIQSKKAINGVNKEKFIYEDAYFKDQALRGKKHLDYLAMLDVNPNDISNDISYCFCTNKFVNGYSADYSNRHMIKVREGINLAASISRKYNLASLEKWLKHELLGATPKTMRNKVLSSP